jgi:hypothetical protein
MTSEERGRRAVENITPQKQTPERDGNESDDTELEEDEAEGHHEEDDSSQNNHQQGNSSETQMRETPQHRWNILRERAQMHDDMAKAYADDVVHQCSTLDESYYHFEVTTKRQKTTGSTEMERKLSPRTPGSQGETRSMKEKLMRTGQR